MSKLFLTSGTGYIGLAVAKAAKQAGHEVTALARSDESAARLQEYGIQVHRGDLRSPETYRNILTKYDAVIHTAATNGKDFPEVDHETVKTVLAALKDTNKVFVYTSGTWVLGNTAQAPATEETPTNPLPLVAWRPQVEQDVIKGAKQGVRTIVIRPTIVYGQGSGIIGQLFAQAKTTGEVAYVGDGNNRWSLVHVDDLARLYLQAIEKAPAGSILHGSTGKPVKQREIAELVAKAAGVPGKVRGQTVEQARTTWGVFADGLAVDQHVEAPQARKLVGWEVSAPDLAQELTQNVKEFASPRK